MIVIVDLLIWPISSFLGAIAAILISSDNPEVIQLQRVCRLTLLAAVTGIVAAVLLFKFAPGTQGGTILLVAFILLIISGFLGRQIETLCKKKHQQNV